MGNVATKLPGTGERQNDCGDPKSSVDERPGARELCRGERLSVFCDHQQPKYWPEHMDRQAQLFLPCDGADGEITWRRRSGNIVTEPLHAHQYCFVAPACLYALRWRNAADVVLLRLGDRLVEEHLAGPMQGVVVEDFKPLSRLDGCLWSLAEAAKRLKVLDHDSLHRAGQMLLHKTISKTEKHNVGRVPPPECIQARRCDKAGVVRMQWFGDNIA